MARTYRFEKSDKKQGGKKSMFSEPRQLQKNELRQLAKMY
jgi:hypothetical protein